MVQAHQDSREEGTTKPIPPQETKVCQILKSFYRCTIESILTGCITAWYGNCSASNHKALQRVVRTAQYITGVKLPVIQDLYTRGCQRKALNIVKDSSHPSHRLFAPHPLLRSCYSLLLSMHSHFNNMYILPQYRCLRTLTLYRYPCI